MLNCASVDYSGVQHLYDWKLYTCCLNSIYAGNDQICLLMSNIIRVFINLEQLTLERCAVFYYLHQGGYKIT